MSGDKFDQLYDALKADGAVQGTRENFKKYVYASGKQGYLNRKKLYDALHADGAVQSATYEEFAKKLGLHAVNPQPKQSAQPSATPQQAKPTTLSDKAQLAYQQYQQGKTQQPSRRPAQQVPQQTRSQAPQAGTTTDYVQNWKLMHMRDDQMTPAQRVQAQNQRARMQRAQSQAYQQEQKATPIARSKAIPTAKSFNETMQSLSSNEAQKARIMQQHQDNAMNMAGGNVNDNSGITSQIDAVVGASMKEASEAAKQQYAKNLEAMDTFASQYERDQAFKGAQDLEQKLRQETVTKNLSAKLQEIYSDKKLQAQIVQSADKLNMGVEEYVDKYVTPQIMNRAQQVLGIKNVEDVMPGGTMGYIAKNLSNSILGMIVAPNVMSKDTRQRMQQGIAIADGLEEMPTVKGRKDNTYRSGIGTRFLSTATNMAMDSGPMALIGGGASASVDLGKRILTNGLMKVGLLKEGANLTAQQLGFKIANMTMAQKIGSGLIEGSAKGALNLAGYSGVTAALGQASTGDDTSLAAIARAGYEGAKHGAETGAMFGLSGAVMAPWVSKFGINGMETSRGKRWLHGAQKAGATALGLGVEAGTMMVADNVTGDKDISVGQWLEDVVMVGAFKAGEPGNFGKIANALHHITHNTNNTFRFGKDSDGNWRTVDIKLNDAEKNELIASTSGKNLMDAFNKVDKSSLNSKDNIDKSITKLAYQEFMNDPNVSQSTKEKVNAAMGLFNTERKRSYRSVNDVQNKQVLEYSQDGTLLTRTPYKNAEERRDILYRQKAYRDNEDLLSLVGYARLKDREYLGKDGKITDNAKQFLIEEGFDLNKPDDDPNNAYILDGLKDKSSEVYSKWVKYADKWGELGVAKYETKYDDYSNWSMIKDMLGVEGAEHNIFTILNKDPLKRTDKENEVARKVKTILEEKLFPENEAHAEQSQSQGKSIAEDNGLGSEQPNSNAVVTELGNLSREEDSLQELMDSNDVFSEEYKRYQSQGLTNPQIYDALVQQSGLTTEDLEPFARYINANARVQGMQQATAEAIEQRVEAMAGDWGFHGTMDGQKADGSQMLYVQDSNGRTLIVGSGDVSYDPTTGKAKEGVGDMLVCFDPNTREMAYVKADETTLFQTQNVEDFKNEERTRLQQINSEPYNQAAAQQAAKDAAKPQPKEEAAPQQPEASASTEGESSPQEQAPSTQQEQPSRKFSDGTDVPMVKDSKGRPTPDYANMKPEQAAEILSEDFGENAEKVVDGQIKKAEKAVKDAEKMKVDYTAEPNDILEQEQQKKAITDAANKQLEHAQAIKKAMTQKKVAETMAKPEGEAVEGANQASSAVAEKFSNAPRLVGNKRTRTLPNSEKIKGHYEIVPAESLTPSHDAMNGYKKSEGFPVDENGRTINDRDYENDKAAQQTTDQMALKYNGQAIDQVPVVSDEGIVYDGNGRTMAGQKAAKDGTDGEYISDLLDNAENFGFTREQIENSGIEHPRLVLVTDERMPYDTATFAKFNRNEKKAQSNTEQAVAKSKTLTSDEIGSIVADIEGNGSLEAFFNNPKAISDLVKTLQNKGIIGQNEVAGLMEGEYLNPQGKELVKNILLGAAFKPETIRMMGIDSAIKTKVVSGIRAVLDNMKLGDYALRDEIDQSIQLLYEARRYDANRKKAAVKKANGKIRPHSVSDYLIQQTIEGSPSERFPQISQALAQALEGSSSLFKDILTEYNDVARANGLSDKDFVEQTLGGGFYEHLDRDALIAEFIRTNKIINNNDNNIKLYGEEGRHSEQKDGDVPTGNEERPGEAGGGAGEEKPTESQQQVEAVKGIFYKYGDTFTLGMDDISTLTDYISNNYKGVKDAFYIWKDAKENRTSFLSSDPNYLKESREIRGKEKDFEAAVERMLNDMQDGLVGSIRNKAIEAVKIALEHSRMSEPEEKSEPITVTVHGNEHHFSSEEVDVAKKILAEYPEKPISKMQREMMIGYDTAKALAKELGWQEKPTFMPKTPEPSNPIEKAAEDYKKEHPLTDEEVSSTTVFDDLPEDQKQYCIDAALDYLHGEDTSAISEAYYRNIYEKRGARKPETIEPTKADEPSSDPMEGLKKAASEYSEPKAEVKPAPKTEKKPQTRKEIEAERDAADDAFESFMKELQKKRRGQLNSGFIDQNLIEAAPTMFSLAAKCAYTRIKLGMYDAKEVIKDLKNRFKEAFEGFDKKDVDLFYSQIMGQKWKDGDQRMSLSDWAEHYRKLSPEHQDKLVGDSKTAEERKQREESFISNLKMIMGGRKVDGIRELRQLAKELGLEGVKDTDLQELAETAVVSRARDIANSKAMSPERKFAEIKKLYANQPSLNMRDSDRIRHQQYSTPAPYAYLADMYVNGNGSKEIKSALEPSAGNGMLTIGLPMDKVHVNDIDEARLMNLHRQGFKTITSQDGTQPFADKDVDAVVTNPPFGSATPKDYDGYKISSLEGQMAINALDSMKDDGRAAIIIGGKTEYAKNGSLNPKDKAFLGYLYSHYNVEDVINVDGSLYAKQGTTYPTRIILINGRRSYDPENKVYPPVEKEARAETVKDYDELYKRINDDILRKRGMQEKSLGLSSGERGADISTSHNGQGEQGSHGISDSKEHGSESESGVSDLGTRGSNERPLGKTERTSSEHLGDNTELGSGGRTYSETDRGLSSGSSRLDNGGRVSESSASGNSNETSNQGRTGRDRIQQGGHGRASGGVQQPVSSREGNGLEIKKEAPKRELNTEKVKYVSQSSNPFSLNSVVPANQAEVTKKALDKIGDVDKFLVDELGYNDKEDMYHALGSEQADSVALAIHQAKQGNAFIIGDMTGIGKGRQAAAMIRYAHKSGKIPVFITARKALFSDMYRDLKSIGNADLKPFIWAAKDDDNTADMIDSEGNLVYKRTSDAEQKRVMNYLNKYGKLPDGYDYIVTTYDSFNSGTMEYNNGKKTARKDGKGSKNGQAKRDLLEAIAKNTNVIMDESHKAGGNGNGSAYLQYIVPKLNAITFLSATYAKKPENMPIYALRTSMNQAGVEPAELIDAIKRGGTTLQEIMSQSLAASGQFIRRERDMTGVTIDWKAIDDPVVVQEQREQYDKIIGLFNDIIDFQRTYVNSYIEQRNEDVSKTQGSIRNKQGTSDLGIKNTPFASRTYNMVRQVLLSLKAKEAAKSAIEHLKNGEKVVIALDNTNESQTGEYAEGVEMEAPDLGVVLKKGLNGVLRYEQTDDMDNKTYGYFNLEDLGENAVARYHEIEENIKNASTGLSLSPIDVIRDELEAAGYSVGEMTGRTYQFVKNPNGTVTKAKRTNTDRKKLALDFNTNKLDALILNRSASTGISLHDSKEFEVEHKPRTMIVVQQQADVNEEVQMRGRIDRTGQVNRGRYEYIVSQIPSEQRLLMMFKAKLKSLDANTTSSQKSKFNDMEVNDIINKYGDRVVKEYMADHLDLYSKMADPFGWEGKYGADLTTIDPQTLANTSGSKIGSSEAGDDASKLLGRMALLKVEEQEKMLSEISDLYTNEINRLNEMGENDLEITEFPLKAKTVGKEVWKEGSEPNGDNAFADNTYIEKVNMAILKKPMKAEEVKKAQDGLTGGRSWDEYRNEKRTSLKQYFDEKIASETERLEQRAQKIAQKAADKYKKEAKKNQEQNQFTDEQIEKNAQFQYDNIYKQEKEKAATAIKNIKTKQEAFERVLDTFNTEDAYVLPSNMNNPNEMSAFGNSYGRLIDIKITDNYSPTASTVSFATLDGRRKITFPVSGKVGSGDGKADVVSSIYRLTKQAEGMSDKQLHVLNMDVNNWDRLVSNESRKDGYIITGNLMQALIDTKSQGLGGQLIKYTTDTGDVKTGILMPDRFKPTDASTDAPISAKADDFIQGKVDDLISKDGDVKLTSVSTWRGTTIELRVPKSTKRGGKYFLDDKLRSLVDGNDFSTKGNSMTATISSYENVRSVLKRLSELGVRVNEERKEGTHFRTDNGVRYSKTDSKDVKNSRIIPEDVDKSVSSQIEKKFNETISDISSSAGEDYAKNLQSDVDYVASLYSNMPRESVEYQKTYYENEIAKLSRGTRHGRSSGQQDGSRHQESYLLSDARTNLAAIERELAYRDVRAKAIRDNYGLQGRASEISPDLVERIFKDGNPSKEQAQLFTKAFDIAKRLGVDFALDSGADTKASGEATITRGINLFLDGLVRTRSPKDSMPRTILHEMLHQATMGAINLVKAGKAEGVLTPKQIEGVNTILDLYKKVKDDKERFKEEPYGLTNEYEFAAQMADPRQRKALDLDIWDRVKNASNELANKGDRSMWQAFKDAVKKLFGVSDKGKMDTALNDIMDDFNEKIDDISMNDIEENGFSDKTEGRQTPSSIVADNVAKVSEKVGSKVNMVNSPEEVTNPAVKERLDKGENVTGWYDEKTGEVHLYMPNIHDTYTAEKTIWHETVGHKAMRGLIGDENYSTFLRNVWYDLDKPENARLKELVDEELKYNPLNYENAVEEGIARLVEDGKGEVGFWNNIRNKVADIFRSIGYHIAPNTKDVKYLLWLSKNLQKNPNNPYWKMRAEAVRYKLEHEHTPVMTDREGMFFGDGKNRDFESMTKAEYSEATDGQIHFRTTPSQGTAIDRYHKALNEHGYMFTESYMDNMLSLQKLMKAIRPDVKNIADINSSENPYILQNTMQGAMSNAAQMFERNVMKPLDKAMALSLDAFAGKDDNEKIRNFNLYMIMKHGLERNRVFFVRDYINKLKKKEETKQDADILQNQWNAEKKDLGDKLRNGSIRLDEYYNQMDEWIRSNVDSEFDADKKDYSGFTALYGMKDSDVSSDAEVIASVMDSEASMESANKGSVKDFWDKVNAATKYSLDCDYNNGLVTKENHDNVSAMFDWYVPLRKFDETTAEDVYGYVTENGDPKSFIGPTLMKAKGRKSLSETNILAQIGAMGNSAINRGGKNAIKQAFARFIRNNGGQGLVTETNVWAVKTGTDVNGKPIWQEEYPQIPEDATPDEISRIVSDFESDMQKKKATGDAVNISQRGNVGFKFERAKDRSQHIVDVMIAGKKHSFIINGNPRAAQALNGLLENSSAKGIMKPLSTISRYMAQLCTSYNPEFVMRNILRDTEFASSNVTAKEGARYGGIWAKYYAKLGLAGAKSINLKDLNGSTGLGLYAKYRNGTLDTTDKIQRYFKEFMDNGGETGWVQVKNMKEWEKQYKSDIKGERSGIVKKSGKMLHDFFFGNLENINEVAENMARFTTYCTSRDFGRSIVRSTYDAKEVSTNFNRHGSGDAIKSFKNGEMSGLKKTERWAYGFSSSYLRHCSMFFNAGIQSTNLLAKNIKTAPKGTLTAMMATPFAFGALAALLNNVLIASEDEKDRKGVKDPYGELPDYIRRNNLCIYKGNGEFVTIPLAIELRAFYGLGDLAAGMTFSPNVSGQKNAAFDAVGCLSQLVPVMDYLGNSSAGKAPAAESVKALSPSAISPVIEWGFNSDWKGSPIERRGDFYDDSPAWQRAYSGTPEMLKSINKAANAYTNDVAKGNPDMMGNKFVDLITNPSMINHFFGGIGGGAATFTERLVGYGKNKWNGEETETKDIPFVRSLFYTPSEQTSMQRTKSKWYNYLDEMETTMANVQKLRSKNVPLDKRLGNLHDLYRFENSKDAEKVHIIESSKKEMKRWKDMLKKSDDNESIKFANQNIDLIMQRAVEELDKSN